MQMLERDCVLLPPPAGTSGSPFRPRFCSWLGQAPQLEQCQTSITQPLEEAGQLRRLPLPQRSRRRVRGSPPAPWGKLWQSCGRRPAGIRDVWGYFRPSVTEHTA